MKSYLPVSSTIRTIPVKGARTMAVSNAPIPRTANISGCAAQAGASEWATPTNGHATNATGQFNIADERSADEVAKLIQRLGYEPVWKDWDAALTV